MTLGEAHARGAVLGIALVATVACEPVNSNRPPMLLSGGTIDDASTDAWVAGPDAGSVRVLAAGIATPSSIALDSSHVYWTDRVGAVWSVPRAGGATTLLTTGQASPLGLVVDGNGYWLSGNGTKAGGSVVTFSFATGLATTLVSGKGGSYAVAAAPSRVFWTAQSPTGTAVDLDAVQADGGAPAQLASVAGATAGGGLAIDVDTAYFAVSLQGGGGAIASVPLAGGPPTTLWTSAGGGPTDVVLGPGAVYWLVPTATPLGAVWTVAAGGTPSALVAGLDAPGHLAVDDVNAYWTSPGEGQIFAVPLTGGAPVSLAGNLATPMALAVDDAIYFTTVDSVLKLTK